jgi:hypothetical protein
VAARCQPDYSVGRAPVQKLARMASDRLMPAAGPEAVREGAAWVEEALALTLAAVRAALH